MEMHRLGKINLPSEGPQEVLLYNFMIDYLELFGFCFVLSCYLLFLKTSEACGHPSTFHLESEKENNNVH